MNKNFGLILSICLVLLSVSCSPPAPKEKKEVALYNSYCASCHIAPEIGSLPKHLWISKGLKDMGARLGIRDTTNYPYEGLAFDEQAAIYKTGAYPTKASIPVEDWELLKEYILSMAPDSLASIPPSQNTKKLEQFSAKPFSLDTVNGSTITFLKYDTDKKRTLIATIEGVLTEFDYANKKPNTLGNYSSAISDYTNDEFGEYITTMGEINPSEIAKGNVYKEKDNDTISISGIVHRPVHTLVHDLNKNGKAELVVSEFGNLVGKLSLLIAEENNTYRKETLLNQPGIIKSVAKDMNADGLDDIVILTSQGDESITILYQEKDLKFRVEKVIRFSPVYGSSWFELLDYDGDGDTDIITVNGDNADKTYTQKPYHGLRIHINMGDNTFEEKFFYPMNGATRMVSRDFDKDGDIDFGVVATFPDYENRPEYAFVYLENKNTENFEFQEYLLEDTDMGRWFLIDSGDVDEDGDEDIILSSLSYSFIPVPEHFTDRWNSENVDILVLENKLIEN